MIKNKIKLHLIVPVILFVLPFIGNLSLAQADTTEKKEKCKRLNYGVKGITTIIPKQIGEYVLNSSPALAFGLNGEIKYNINNKTVTILSIGASHFNMKWKTIFYLYDNNYSSTIDTLTGSNTTSYLMYNLTIAQQYHFANSFFLGVGLRIDDTNAYKQKISAISEDTTISYTKNYKNNVPFVNTFKYFDFENFLFDIPITPTLQIGKKLKLSQKNSLSFGIDWFLRNSILPNKIPEFRNYWSFNIGLFL